MPFPRLLKLHLTFIVYETKLMSSQLHGSMLADKTASNCCALHLLVTDFVHCLIILTLPQAPTISLPQYHENTHFNHLDFHYHCFLFSLFKLLLLTSEPWTKINSLPCLHQKIPISPGSRSFFSSNINIWHFIFNQNQVRSFFITCLKKD